MARIRQAMTPREALERLENVSRSRIVWRRGSFGVWEKGPELEVAGVVVEEGRRLLASGGRAVKK